MKRLIIFSLVLCATLLSACAPRPEACWEPEAKKNAEALFREQALEAILKRVTAESPEKVITPEMRHNLDGNLSLKLTSFYAISTDQTSGAAHCGAWPTISVARDKEKPLSASPRLLTFSIYKSENGKMYTIDRLPIFTLVSELE